MFNHRCRRVGKAQRAHHLAACSVKDGGHVAALLCPPYATECASVFSRHDVPEVCIFVCPPRNMRAQGRPGACRTRGPMCCLRMEKRCTRAYRFGGSIPAFPAQWFYGLYRALPGERLFCLRRLRGFTQGLTPAPRHQDHTTSPYASGAYVYRTLGVHRIPPRVRDVRERPSYRAGYAELCD